MLHGSESKLQLKQSLVDWTGPTNLSLWIYHGHANMRSAVLPYLLSLLLLVPSLIKALVSPGKVVNTISERHVQERPLQRRAFFTATGAALAWATSSATAAPTKDISNLDFSGQDLSNKDFSKMIARKTKFQNSNLKGSIFDNADLTGADFSGANVQEASFIDATLDGSKFTNAQAQKSKFNKTILDVGDFENVDLTDSMWPSR